MHSNNFLIRFIAMIDHYLVVPFFQCVRYEQICTEREKYLRRKSPVVQDNTNWKFDYVAADADVVDVDDDVCVVDVDAQDFGFVKILTCCS